MAHEGAGVPRAASLSFSLCDPTPVSAGYESVLATVDELLSAVDVVGRAGERRVDHDVNGNRGVGRTVVAVLIIPPINPSRTASMASVRNG